MNCELPDEDISRPRFAVNSLVEVFSSNFLSSTAGNLKTIKWKVVVILPSISPGIQTPAVIGWLTQAHQKSTRKLNKEACWLTYTHRPVDNILSSMPPVKRMYLHTANHTRKQTTSCPYLYTHYLSPLKCPLLFHAVILTGVASFQVITRKKSQNEIVVVGGILNTLPTKSAHRENRTCAGACKQGPGAALCSGVTPVKLSTRARLSTLQ